MRLTFAALTIVAMIAAMPAAHAQDAPESPETCAGPETGVASTEAVAGTEGTTQVPAGPVLPDPPELPAPVVEPEPEPAPLVIEPPLPVPLTPEELRREKCAYLWQRVNANSFDTELADFLCGEHERAGLDSEWFYSFCYFDSGSSLNPRMTFSAGGMTARGIADCTELLYPRGQCKRRFGTTSLHDPWVSIANHVYQAKGIHASTGRRGWSLMRAVFLPANPDGWRARLEQYTRWLPRAHRFERLLERGYRAGKIGGGQ